jgi:hypothetical protein
MRALLINKPALEKDFLESMFRARVMVTLNQKESIVEVKVESREYDHFAKRFIEEI